MNKIKQYFENKKQKRKEYWDNLDLDRQIKIEQIKESRARQDHESSKSMLKFFAALTICLLMFPTMMLIYTVSTHFFNAEHYEQIEEISK